MYIVNIKQGFMKRLLLLPIILVFYLNSSAQDINIYFHNLELPGCH